MTKERPQGPFEAQVIGAFGRHLQVRDSRGERLSARPRGRGLQLVCGDRVRCEWDAQHAQLLVTEALPRRTCLYRSSAQGRTEPVVANLAHVLVVLAPLPAPDWFVIDRYLCAASSAGLAAALVVNKCELGLEPLQTELAAYAGAGYPCVACSARTGEGIEALPGLFAAGSGVLVGQSGVGKSALVRCLAPEADALTGELTRAAEGRHTTTASRLYELAQGGELIDSPGVRDFAPALEQLDARSLGFPEVNALAAHCRFADCSHMQEPGCAVRTAAQEGKLPSRRYESYRRLRRLRADLTAARGPRRRP